MYRICNRCVMDTTDPDIVFDERGCCNHCEEAIKKVNDIRNRDDFLKIIEEIKQAGRQKKYDCVVGISGGVDSSYLLWLLTSFDVRPFVVHIDNGYNAEIADKNMQKVTQKLHLELHRYPVDTAEFRDLQLSFLKASVADLEIPTDHALVSLLNKIARLNKIRYVVSGHNAVTESIAVPKWSHGHYDWRYIKLIQKRFGTKKLRHYAHTSLFDVLYEQVLGRVKTVRLLNYVNHYDKKAVIQFLKEQFGWENYITKHGESMYTFFIQAYVLPKKFGYDKRRMHLSNLICAGQMTRDEALQELCKPLFTEEEKILMTDTVCARLNITRREFNELMSLPNKSYYDYPSYETHPVYRIIRDMYKKIRTKG